MLEPWVFYVLNGYSHQPPNLSDVLFLIIMTWTLNTFGAFILVSPDRMHDDVEGDNDDLSLVFYLLYLFSTQASFALFRPQKNQYLAHNREQENGGGGGCSFSYLSLNKSVQ